jgi:hypothetical protein
MNQSENINELAASLSKAQGEMQAAIKDSINPFFKSKYADLGSVWDAARPVLCKYGLCVMQSTEILGEKIVMSTILAHSSGQWVKSYLPLNPSKNDSQGMGAAMTYLRRYSLSALVGVVCDEDDDGETAVGRGKIEQQNKKPAPIAKSSSQDNLEIINKDQLNEILELDKQVDDAFRANIKKYLKDTYKIEDYAMIPAVAFKVCIRGFNNNIKMNKEKQDDKTSDGAGIS